MLREAERLVAAGVRELLVISQDTSAYGLDLRHATAHGHRSHITDLARELGRLGAWVRLHYVYPYPHVRELIPLMADPESGVLPYLDIPFQHAHPDVLKRMARPAKSADTLAEIAAWRAACPDLTLRSTFIVGYPGETEAEFQYLLDWLGEAQLDRVGCFKYENVSGARANALPDHVPEDVKDERWHRFMARRRRSPRRGCRPGSAPACRRSWTRSTTRPPPAAPWPTRPRSTATCSSMKASRRSRPATSSPSRWRRPPITTSGGASRAERARPPVPGPRPSNRSQISPPEAPAAARTPPVPFALAFAVRTF